MITESNVKDALNDTKDESNDIMTLFEEVNEGVKSVKDNLLYFKSNFQNNKVSAAKGLSILEVKNQMLLSYLANMVYLVLRKCHGKCITGDPIIEHLIEIRTVIERIKPIENKLKYQINKLIKTAATGTSKINDPIHFRANPDNMTNELSPHESDGESVNDGIVNDSDSHGRSKVKAEVTSEKDKSGIFVPPKLMAVYYDEDNASVSKRQKLIERARKHALSSSVMQELGEEYLDTPAEISQATSFRQKQTRSLKEKQEYEETYFTRLPISKKDMHKNRSVNANGNLNGITDFEDVSVLDPSSNYRPIKKRKQPLKKTSHKKGFKSKKRRFN